MNKVKVFTDSSSTGLESRINLWLKELDYSKTIVINIEFAVDKGGLSSYHALLWYRIEE